MPEVSRFWSFEDLGIKDYVPEELSAEEKLADDLLSGNASPAVHTPLANSGNITPDDDNQIADRESMEIGGQGGENEGNEVGENSNDKTANSAPPLQT